MRRDRTLWNGARWLVAALAVTSAASCAGKQIDGRQLVPLEEVDRGPELIECPAYQEPVGPARTHVFGYVQFWVGVDGRVVDPHPWIPATVQNLDPSSPAALKIAEASKKLAGIALSCRYEPATVDGEAVPSGPVTLGRPFDGGGATGRYPR